MARILVVEDEPAIAELITLNLRHDGHEVQVAGSSQDAEAAIRAALPDLVLLDWMLPGESGLQLAQRWRRDVRTRDLPIVMLTARSEERDMVQGLDGGADDYLSKPFSPSVLVARIRSVLRRKAPQSLDTAVQIGALLLDPVAVPGFSDHLRTVSEQGRRPVLALRANSSECNARHSASAALHQVHGEALPGRGFVGVQLTEGSTHVDAEGEDSDVIARLACGQPLPANIVRVRTLAAAWALAIAQGQLPSPPAEMAGLKLVD